MINIPQLKAKISILAISIIFSAFSASVNAAGKLIGLGVGVGAFDYTPLEINANGNIVTGEVELDGLLNYEDGIWTQATGTVRFSEFYGGQSGGFGAVNSDGSVVVGSYVGNNGIEAFRWTQTGGIVGLGRLSGSDVYSEARGVSGNGSVVVGTSIGYSGSEAFRWTQTDGLVGLGYLPGGSSSDASLISADGTVIIGRSSSINGSDLFRWTQAEGMVGVSTLFSGSYDFTSISGLSADGSVIVGRSSDLTRSEAFLWSQSGGVVDLGYLSTEHLHSRARGISSNGSVVVGSSFTYSDSDEDAFLWTETGGMVNLMEWLTSKDVDLSGFTKLVRAQGISADGNTIVGYGFNSAGQREGFVVTVTAVPEPESLAMLLAGLGLIGFTQRRKKQLS